MKNDLLPALKKELENSFGRKVLSSRDCLQMVDDIYQKTGYTINTNTLRRFFGLVRTNYSASPSTLSILLKYCGFNSLDELEKISHGINTVTAINTEEVHHYLVALFKNLVLEEDNNAIIESLIQQTVVFLERNPSLIERFQREIATSPAGQYYYYERSVNMDRLNGYYSDGLRFYLRAKSNNEALVFSNSVQVLRYWLANSPELLEDAMFRMGAVNVNNSYPTHIYARYIAARLYYAHSKGDPIDKIIGEASRYYSSFLLRNGSSNPDFELIMTEALILTNHYSEASEYIKRGKSRLTLGRKIHSGENPFGPWEKMIIGKRNMTLKAIMPPSKTTLSAVSSSSPLTKRYYAILNLLAASKTKRTNFADLIRETGFYRLS